MVAEGGIEMARKILKKILFQSISCQRKLFQIILQSDINKNKRLFEELARL